MEQKAMQEFCSQLGVKVEFRPIDGSKHWLKIPKEIKDECPDFYPIVSDEPHCDACAVWYLTNWSATVTVKEVDRPDSPADDWEDEWQVYRFEAHTGYNGNSQQWYRIGKLGDSDVQINHTMQTITSAIRTLGEFMANLRTTVLLIQKTLRGGENATY